MKLKLLDDVQGLKAGREWNCPSAALGRKLIEEGRALALEECDAHLNPPAEGDEAEPAEAPPAIGQPTEQPKPTPAPKLKAAKKPKPPKK